MQLSNRFAAGLLLLMLALVGAEMALAATPLMLVGGLKGNSRIVKDAIDLWTFEQVKTGRQPEMRSPYVERLRYKVSFLLDSNAITLFEWFHRQTALFNIKFHFFRPQTGGRPEAYTEIKISGAIIQDILMDKTGPEARMVIKLTLETDGFVTFSSLKPRYSWSTSLTDGSMLQSMLRERLAEPEVNQSSITV